MALVAYTLGARIIEETFAANEHMKGTDHKFSLEPQGPIEVGKEDIEQELALNKVLIKYFEIPEVNL